MTLAELKPGQSAVILSMNDRNDEGLHRLDELGFVEGQLVTVLKEAPLGDPIAVRIMNYELCLRKKEANLIQVEPREPNP